MGDRSGLRSHSRRTRVKLDTKSESYRTGNCKSSEERWTRLRRREARRARVVELNDHTTTTPAPSTIGSGRTVTSRTQPRTNSVRRSGTRRRARTSQRRARPRAVLAESALTSADLPPPIRIVLGSAGELPPGSLYMERSFGLHGEPEVWSNPCRSHGTDAGAHEEAVREYRERLWSPAGKWLRLGFFHLINRRCACHCAARLPCHIDALQDAFPRLTPDRSSMGCLLPELGKTSARWLTWAWGLPPHGKWKHGSTEPGGAAKPVAFPALISLTTRSHDPSWPRLRCKERRTCMPWSYGPAKTRG